MPTDDVILRRTVRFCINPGEEPGADGTNGYAGRPPMRGLGRYYELDFACAGKPDPRSGYLINIKDIDRAARRGAVPLLARACEEAPGTDPAALLSPMLDAAAGLLPVRLASITLRLTPTLELTMDADDRASVLIRQSFDFAAAHRLHVPELSDEQNRALFGRCNNPSGHGHNYRVRPSIRVPLTDRGAALSIDDIERLTEEHVIGRFDHTHLNEDTDPFGPGGVNPSVENIARVFYELLAIPVAEAGATLESVTVWETDRTSCTYPG